MKERIGKMKETENKVVQEEVYKSGSVQYIDSREVAEMVGKEHKKLLRDIRTYINQIKEISEGQNPKSKIGLSDSEAKRKIEFSDFFIESSYYVDGQSRTYPCYKVTLKGCEFIAHKLTGIKGTEFTVKYINRFHDMEDKMIDGKVLQQFMEQQIKTNQVQTEFNQKMMERLEHLENPGKSRNRGSYKVNPFLTANDVEERKEEIYVLTARLAELWGCQHTQILHQMYKMLEIKLEIVLDCYKSVYRSETGRQYASMAEVIASHDWLYENAVRLCERTIEKVQNMN